MSTKQSTADDGGTAMKQSSERRLLIIAAACIALGAAGVTRAAVEGVSPGDANRVTTVASGCPTFSWQADEGASFYELVVYRLPPGLDPSLGGELNEEYRVLSARLPAGVTTWTPSLEDALEPGQRYAWFIRPGKLDDEGEILGFGDWSRARLFLVSTAPSSGEVKNALEVLNRYLSADVTSGEISAADAVIESRRVSDRKAAGITRQTMEPVTELSVPSGAAAVKGEMPDPSGETYGVVGISSSSAGAGIGAANVAGGPDLVLDGSLAGVADARLRESGIDRPSPSAQSFDITNSGAGAMSLRVDGVEVVTTLTDHDTLAGLACGSGQLAKWNGSSWLCAADDDTLAAMGCAPDQVVKWTGSTWSCADDENTVLEIGPGLILDNGRILIDPTMFYVSHTILDGPGEVGRHASVAVGSDGLGLISYWDETNNDLKVAHCNDVECTSATVTTLDSAGDVGQHSAVVVGTDGLGLISYYDATNQDLKLAHCNDVGCTSATITTLDSTGAAGLDTALAIGSDGLPLVAYRANGLIKVAHCDDALCASANLGSLESGSDPSIAIGSDGLGLISYGSGGLKVAHCSDLLCSSYTTTTVDASVSVARPSLVIGIDGLGFVGYYDGTNYLLKTAHCSNVACTSAYIKSHTPEPGLWEGIGPSVGIGADGLPLVAHCDSPAYALKVTKCEYVHCGVATTTTAYTADSDWFSATAMAIGADGLPLIAASEVSGDDLWVVHLPYGF
jgi:hypothetical protein